MLRFSLSINKLGFVCLVFLSMAFPGVTNVRAQEISEIKCTAESDVSIFAKTISAIGAKVKTLKISSAGSRPCVAGTIIIPANVTVDNIEGLGVTVETGKTLTILGNIINPSGKQIFFNAWPGQGTVSFKGNRNIAVLHPEWWGAKTESDDAPALNACSAAAATMIAADIEIVDTYNLATTWKVGVGTPFTSISLKGHGAGSSGSTLKWIGPPNGVMLNFWANKFADVERIRFQNGVEKGATVGMRLSGPGNGTQSNNYNVDNCIFSGFNYGVQAGDPMTTAAASELSFRNVVFDGNDNGFLGTSSGNTLVITFLNCSFGSNKNIALDLGSSGDCHIFGGGFGNNGIDITGTAWTGTLAVTGARFEVISPEIPLSVNGIGTVAVRNCTFAGDPARLPKEAIIRGATNLTFENNYVGRPGEPWIVYDFGNGGSGKNYQMAATNNVIYGKLLNIRTDNGAIDGLRTLVDGVRSEVVWPNLAPHAIGGQGRLAGGSLRVKLIRRRDTNYSITFSSDADERLHFANKTVDGFDIVSSDRTSSSNVTWTVTKN
ncbi:MAG TPA: hypothetical protein VN643_08085 [Pyrinomonadaceae bacterium]|nr:hypothetical protein [Pyrinomonadaceae bacterium]